MHGAMHFAISNGNVARRQNPDAHYQYQVYVAMQLPHPTWTNVDPDHRRIYAVPVRDELKQFNLSVFLFNKIRNVCDWDFSVNASYIN